MMMIDDDDDDDDGDLFQVVSEHRETTALKLIVIHFAEIQNWGRC